MTTQDFAPITENQETPYFEYQLKGIHAYQLDYMNISDAPYFASDPNDHTLYIKNIPATLSRWTILESIEQIPGFVNFSVSAPVKANEDQRMAWIGFDSDQSMNQALSNLNGQVKVQNNVLILAKQQERRKNIRVCGTLDSNKLHKDYSIQRELISALDNEKGIDGNPLTQGPVKDRDDPIMIRALDLQTLYLRKVHSYCYWSAGEFVTERALNQKCGCVFLRVNNDNPKQNDQGINWQEAIQTLARKRVEDSKNGLTQQEPFQEILDREIMEKTIKSKSLKSNKLNIEIYPCTQCAKQFKGQNYLVKHIFNKHPIQYEQLSAQIKDKVITQQIIETYKREKFSKIAIQRVVFGGASFDDDMFLNKKIVQPLNFAPRPQQRVYKDLDNILTEKTIPQNIIIAFKESSINYNDI